MMNQKERREAIDRIAKVIQSKETTWFFNKETYEVKQPANISEHFKSYREEFKDWVRIVGHNNSPLLTEPVLQDKIVNILEMNGKEYNGESVEEIESKLSVSEKEQLETVIQDWVKDRALEFFSDYTGYKHGY